jgi:hypothetical protein
MSKPAMVESQSTEGTKAVRHRKAIWTLLVLAPVIGEVLSGSTRLSVHFVLLPEIMVWGVGALLARELVRRWRAGVPSLLLLGLALSVAEEFIIQQTSLAPLPFPGANAEYGRFLGVNWVYFLFMLGYESVWIVLVPVQVTELLFPERREQPWLRKGGVIACCIAFVVGCRIAWYGWTQQALPRMHVAPYHPPATAIGLGLTVIGLLIALAYAIRGKGLGRRGASAHTGSPWIAAIAAFILPAAWWALMALIFNPRPAFRASTALVAGVIWAVLGFFALWRLSATAAWNDRHRWAVSAGATVACMAPGYLSLAGWTTPDLAFKILTNLMAVAGLVLLGRTVWRRRG